MKKNIFWQRIMRRLRVERKKKKVVDGIPRNDKGPSTIFHRKNGALGESFRGNRGVRKKQHELSERVGSRERLGSSGSEESAWQ